MKNKIILFAMLLVAGMFPIQLNAQLEVLTSGSVKLSKRLAIGTDVDGYISLNIDHTRSGGGATPYYGIKSQIKMPANCPNSPIYGVYGIANATGCSHQETPYPIAGVYGMGVKNYNTSTIFSAGVAGMAYIYGGIGVYGGIGLGSLPSTLPADAKYAGYFSGATKVTGTLLANMIVLNGDTLNLNNVRALSSEPSRAIDLLRPISYSFKSDTALQYDEKTQQEMSATHYGLVAQDVQKVLPEIIYERDGQMSINYIELIPLLIQRIQELSKEVEELKKQNK